MKHLLIIFSLTIIFGTAMANDKVTAALDQYAWKKRQLIIFAPNIEHPQYQLYRKHEAAFESEFKDRKLHSWFVVADLPVRLNQEIYKDLNSQDVREAFNIKKSKFQLLLIGYDQGVKMRQSSIDIKAIFSEIDSMPMRAQEMRTN